jgi:hypothetical protein
MSRTCDGADAAYLLIFVPKPDIKIAEEGE